MLVPLAGWSSVLPELHGVHPGVLWMKALARGLVWWPGIDQDIEGVSTSPARIPTCTTAPLGMAHMTLVAVTRQLRKTHGGEKVSGDYRRPL